LKSNHLIGAVALALSAASTAWAGPVSHEFGPNLVTNGSFEASSTVAGSGFTTSGQFTSEGFDYFIDTDPADAHSGSNSFAGGAVGGLGFLTQTIATTAGTAYNIHFWIANFSGFADGTALQVLWNGQQVYSATDILGSGYTEIVIDPLATSALTTLSFGLQDDSFFLNLDDISVRAVPEPAELVLLLAGFAAAASMRRRRKTG
jgi:hypothetical protein